jgi:hypothetical protein
MASVYVALWSAKNPTCPNLCLSRLLSSTTATRIDPIYCHIAQGAKVSEGLGSVAGSLADDSAT